MGMLYYVHADEGDVRESDGFRAREIKLPTKSSNLAEITLDKRYPKQGRALNEDVEMTVYVLEGSVRFSSEGGTKEFGVGSTIFVRKKQRYFWEPVGEVRFLAYSTPPWTPEQHKEVP